MLLLQEVRHGDSLGVRPLAHRAAGLTDGVGVRHDRRGGAERHAEDLGLHGGLQGGESEVEVAGRDDHVRALVDQLPGVRAGSRAIRLGIEPLDLELPAAEDAAVLVDLLEAHLQHLGALPVVGLERTALRRRDPHDDRLAAVAPAAAAAVVVVVPARGQCQRREKQGHRHCEELARRVGPGRHIRCSFFVSPPLPNRAMTAQPSRACPVPSTTVIERAVGCYWTLSKRAGLVLYETTRQRVPATGARQSVEGARQRFADECQVVALNRERRGNGNRADQRADQDTMVARCSHHLRDRSWIDQRVGGQLDAGDEPEPGTDLGDLVVDLQRREHGGKLSPRAPWPASPGLRAPACRGWRARRHSTSGGRRTSPRAGTWRLRRPRTGRRPRRRRSRRPLGRYPLVTPLANVIRSGRTPCQRWTPNQSPSRPNPQITSSAMKSTPCSAHRLAAPSRYPSGGRRTPPAPMTGSQKKAATFSGPSRWSSRSSASTESCSTTAVWARSGPHPDAFASIPAMLVPKPCVPW